MDEEKLNKLYQLIADNLGVELGTINPESEFLNDFNVTESEVEELLTKIQNEFELEFDDVNVRNITTVKSLIEAIEEAEI